MDSRQLLLLGGGALVALIAIALFLLPTQPAREQGVVQEKTRLVWAAAGDLTMISLMQNVVAPAYEEKNPHVSIVTIHTGPGEPGSRLIFEKLKAAKDAGKACWDIDVAIINPLFFAWASPEEYLLPYARNVSTSKFVTSEYAKTAMGRNIEGYVIPFSHSQIAIAYNTKYVKNPPKSYAEVAEWVKQNPGKFGYNGVKGGLSGPAFIMGWIYWKTGEYEKLTKGPYDEALRGKIEAALLELKEFNKNVKITAGNIGTLDMLAREEIWMGPVWIDLFYTWVAEGKMPEHIRLTMIEPGLPGLVLLVVIPAKACNVKEALKFAEYITSPEVQAKVVVEKYNWHPGIDSDYIMDKVSEKAKQRLFGDITPEMLRKYRRLFPILQYYSEIISMYERIVG
ncbi:MAG: extracellular solute-binding protein [Acidilobaceae archaeon]|nr:extracellular solute-binding protein [Acidilobaceae archaeon]MCX8165068.1 extracellular solute-binding protein [Acidilobaceae archaeon]MDW7974415.1 extracellular solute-binding protein [Sulfolobales archaeon]